MPYLTEIPESQATGRVAGLYEDMRAVIGLPLVNLVYRHLAVDADRLERAWEQLRPNLADAAMDAAEADLLEAARADAAPLSRATLQAVGLDDPALVMLADTLDAYNRANPRNLVALLALLHGAPGGGGHVPAAPAPHRSLFPIADIATLAPATRALLDEMAVPFAAAGESVLIPGLFRHFAHSPALLALLWAVLRPLADGAVIARRGNVVARRAHVLAAGLPGRVEPTADAHTSAVLARFTATIPRMVVAGAALRQAVSAAV